MIEQNHPGLSIGGFYGVRQMTWHLQTEGHAVNVRRIRRLIRLMRLMPIFQKPDTSKPATGHKTYPYLLGGFRVERPSQAWCDDISYLPMRRGFLYLVAIMDWFTRKVQAWRISQHIGSRFLCRGGLTTVYRASFSSACNRTFVPAAKSSAEAYSFTLWLTPSRHGTKIIAVGATLATLAAS